LQNLNDVLIKVSPKYIVVTLAPRTICKTVKSPDNYLTTQPPKSPHKNEHINHTIQLKEKIFDTAGARCDQRQRDERLKKV